MSEEKYLCVIAGPNGSGKSSSVEQAFGYYDKIGVKPAYLCPDDVCLQLMKKDPDTDRTNAAALAKNIVLEKRNEFLEKGISFITETVFCHESHLAFMKKAKKAGYNVRLIYVATDSPDINVARVKKRVRQGGHNVEEEKIRSRYYRSLALLKKAVDIADTAEIRDNSTEGELAKTCAVKMFGNVYQTRIIRTSPEARLLCVFQQCSLENITILSALTSLKHTIKIVA